MKKLKSCLSLSMIGMALVVGAVLTPTYCDAKQSAYVQETPYQYEEETVHRYRHKESGLSVIWIENDDVNKSFMLGVKTPTTDSTGVNHIIEHTVFTGSKKYPSPTLFFDASSQYPHLFMNAMTSSDLTMYPFSTPYEACYNHLLDVYLDSILNPLMLEQSENFYEESFYYNPIKNETGGVVYNEMKGTTTNVERTLFKMIRSAFYDGTYYCNDSGGSVEEIPKLTYEGFKTAYEQYYYPANMQIVLYGDLAIDKTLETIDGYFKERPLTDKIIDVNVEVGKVEREQALYYESRGDYGSVVKAFQLKESPSVEEKMELELWLETYLLGDDTTFMKTLKSKGLKQVQFIKDDALETPLYAIVAMGVKEDEKERASQILEGAFERALNEKRKISDEKDVIARNKVEMEEKDQSSLRGVTIAETYIDEWAHKKEANSYFKEQVLIETIETIEKGKELLNDETIYSTLTIMPTGYIANQSEISRGILSDEQWCDVIENMERWQNSKPQNTLEKVNLDKLVIIPEVVPKIYKENGMTYMLTEDKTLFTEHHLYIPTNHMNQEQLPYLFLYSHLLEQSAKEMKPYPGKIKVDIISLEKKDTLDHYIKVTMLPIEGKEAYNLWEEMRQALADKESTWYVEQMATYVNTFKQATNADLLGTLKLLSKKSQTGAKRYGYEVEYGMYDFCTKMTMSALKTIKEDILAVGDKLYFTEDTAIGLIGEKRKIKEEKEKWYEYTLKHKVPKPSYNDYSFKKEQGNTLYEKNSPVDYMLLTYDKEKDTVDGLDYVMSAYATNAYLQPIIRAEKGAYGVAMHATFPNTLMIYTYRDPNFKTSAEAISKMIPILRGSLNDTYVERAKADGLGQMQQQFKLLEDTKSQISVMERLILTGYNLHCIKKLQKEIISTDLKALDEKLALTDYLISQSHIGLCTDPKRHQ